VENAQFAPIKALARARETASRLYGSIGINLKWSNPSKASIRVCLDKDTLSSFHPGALGYAAPYGKSGTRIHILIDRITDTGSKWLEGALLGHAMAHELGHVLEGFSGHSETGVMKAHWNRADYDRMLEGAAPVYRQGCRVGPGRRGAPGGSRVSIDGRQTRMDSDLDRIIGSRWIVAL